MTIDRLPRRRAAVLIAGAPLLLSACGRNPGQQPNAPQESGGSDPTAPPPTPEASPTTPPVEPMTVSGNVDDGAEEVTVDTIVKFTAAHGTLTKVVVSAPVKDRKTGETTNEKVPGSLNKDKTVWKATDGLEPGVPYTVKWTGKGTDGTKTSGKQTFRTHELTLDQQIFPSIYPLGGTVGVAMPVIITFDIPVKDRANVEKHLHVDASPKQPGSWYWVSDSEVHYRPKTYWKAGTKITVDARLNGVKAGKGLYGQLTRTWSFDIGRRVVAKVDLAKHQVVVAINGKKARTIKMSAGKDGFITRSGTKVISEKLRTTPMRSETEDVNDPEYYDLDNVRWAMRVTNSGEFFHAAPWNAAFFGNSNRSHGCVGMSNADAKWLFENMNIGDPAEFTGSKRGLEQGNGYTDWTLSWAQVKKKSALRGD